jgi:hypothetical protein
MTHTKHMTGMKFGRLTVREITSKRNGGEVYWLCDCECGEQITARGGHFRSGGIQSCGCLNFRDLAGLTFGRLIVCEMTSQRDGGGSIGWLCDCECGEQAIVYGGNLTSGSTKSCGCLGLQRLKERIRTTHGMSLGGPNPHKLYLTWVGILTRTTNPNSKHFEDYGGRGISVASRLPRVPEVHFGDTGRAARGQDAGSYR